MGKFKMRKPNPKGLKSPMKQDDDFTFDASLLPKERITHAAESTSTQDIDTIGNLERAMKEEDDKHIAILPDGTTVDIRDIEQDVIKPDLRGKESLQHYKGNILNPLNK